MFDCRRPCLSRQPAAATSVCRQTRCILSLAVALAMAGCAGSSLVLPGDPEAAITATNKLPEQSASPIAHPHTADPRIAPPQHPESTAASTGTVTTIVHPGSVLDLAVVEDPALNGIYTVADDGSIQLKDIGTVFVGNMSVERAQGTIAAALAAGSFRRATVLVKCREPVYGRVQVQGEVMNPGFVRIGTGLTISLAEALLRTGGAKDSARRGTVRVIRGGLLAAAPFALEYEQYPLLTPTAEGPRIPDVRLGANDMVTVFAAAEPAPNKRTSVILVFLSERWQHYLFGPGEPCTMLYLALKLGRLPLYTNTKNVRIVRMTADGSRETLLFDASPLLSRGDPEKDLELQDGDCVIFPERHFSLF